MFRGLIMGVRELVRQCMSSGFALAVGARYHVKCYEGKKELEVINQFVDLTAMLSCLSCFCALVGCQLGAHSQH